jgi:outer membrane protein OmpA-like peptidoglycan-associated protein
LISSFLILGLSACSGGPAIQDIPNTANPADEISKLGSEISAAMTNQVNVLAPNSFEQAKESFNDAKKSLDQQRASRSTLREVAKSRAYLKQALNFATVAHQNIDDVLIARSAAIDAKGPSLKAKEFEAADEKLRDVTSDIEENNLKSAAKNRSALQMAYLDIELQSIKAARLGPSTAMIGQARKEGAAEFAPRMLAIAEKSVLDTDAFITANRHNTAQVEARSMETLKNAEHVLKITRDSKSGNKTSSEETALLIETEKTNVAHKQNQIEQGASANAALSAENSNLEADQALDRKYEEARTQFNSNEAEVYKQGRTLVIRLRGLEFSPGTAVLKGSNFALLSKVQNVIAKFEHGSVIVEGHTDSDGGKLLNDKLSADRAEAVKQYFVANNQGQPLEIKSVGYGFQKPLSSNKTPAGRAQNRRVDVLIRPDSRQSDPSTL